jgi:hypothetical protein
VGRPEVRDRQNWGRIDQAARPMTEVGGNLVAEDRARAADKANDAVGVSASAAPIDERTEFENRLDATSK